MPTNSASLSQHTQEHTQSHANPHSHVQEFVVQDTGLPQPFMVLPPSLWPLLTTLFSGLLALGAVLLFHKTTLNILGHTLPIGSILLLFSTTGLLLIAGLWWYDVVREARRLDTDSKISASRESLRLGMALFIASEAMFFASFFAAWFAGLFGAPPDLWPPKHINMPNPLDVPFLMTTLLLLSGSTVTWAHHAIQEGNQRDTIRALGITVVLGACFTALQAFEYHHIDFSLKSGMFGSTFYMATGFHGLHVILGTIFLAVCLIRARRGGFTADRHLGLEFAAWYWHFVDVVWLFLFVAVYALG